MATSVGEITATLKLKNELTPQLKAVEQQLGLTGQKLGQTGSVAAATGVNFASLGAKVQGFGSTLSSLGTLLSVGVTAPLVGVGALVTKLGIDAVESENLFSVSFGDMADAAREWSVVTSDALGLNEFELRRNSGVIFTMVESMGLGKDAAFSMATGISELSADMASFFNLKPEEAFDKLRAGIVGETEPLRRLGILVDENTVKQTAYRNGIAELGAELSQQQKVAARWVAILEQTSKAQGDLSRTLDSPANQLRRLKEETAEAATKLGIALMPVIQQVTTLLVNLVPVIQRGAEWFGQLSPNSQLAALGVAAVAAATGPALIVLGSLARAIGALIPLLGTVLPTAATASATSLSSLRLLLLGASKAVIPLTILIAGLTTAWRSFRREISDEAATFWLAQLQSFLSTGQFINAAALKSSIEQAAQLARELGKVGAAAEGTDEQTDDMADAIAEAERQIKFLNDELRAQLLAMKPLEDASKKQVDVWAKWRAFLSALSSRSFPDMTDAYLRSTSALLRGQQVVTQGLAATGIQVQKLGGIWEGGVLDVEQYKDGLAKALGFTGERVVTFSSTMKSAFTDIKGIVSGTLSGMVDDFFDKFGILGNILSGFINNAITWVSDWAFGLLGLGKAATTTATQVVAANQAAAASTQAAASVAASSIASWLGLAGSIFAVFTGVTALFNKLFPTTPVTGQGRIDPGLRDPAKKQPEPTDPGDSGSRGFAGGTQGRFLDFGTGTPVTLHGRERVMTEAEGSRDSGLLAAIERRLAELPQLMAVQVRDALATARVR